MGGTFNEDETGWSSSTERYSNCGDQNSRLNVGARDTLYPKNYGLTSLCCKQEDKEVKGECRLCKSCGDDFKFYGGGY